MRQQEATREVPIVLLTTRGEESYMEAGFQSGCNDYLTKPVDGDELVSKLDKIFQHNHEHDTYPGL